VTKNGLLVSIVQTVTGDKSDKFFRCGTPGKLVIMDGLSAQTVATVGNCLFRSRIILMEDGVRYNRLWQKAVAVR
jgi:hypothetical protein